MATSGTISKTVFSNQKIIDNAFRRCKMLPQQIGSEDLITALDLLWLDTSTLVNAGIKLWNIDKIILPIYERRQSITFPLGTVDLFNMNLRTQERLTGVATATEGVAQNAFDSNLTTACVQTTAGGSITMTLPSAAPVTTYGFMPATSGTWDFISEASEDNFVTTIPLLTKTAHEVVAGEWLWFDIEGVVPLLSYRLRATGTTILSVIELVFQNTPQEIPMAQLNLNDYSNLPDKVSTGRPTQFWWDKQRSQPVGVVWPAPGLQFTLAQFTCYVQTYMQDVGSLTQELDIPQRWYMAIVCRLAAQLGREIKQVDAAMIPILDQDAAKFTDDAWTGENDNSDIHWIPNISPYTK